jgi:hypothetical protein
VVCARQCCIDGPNGFSGSRIAWRRVITDETSAALEL